VASKTRSAATATATAATATATADTATATATGCGGGESQRGCISGFQLNDTVYQRLDQLRYFILLIPTSFQYCR
jgi:hypothetical protein